jgi:REase_DpnII-MboI/Uncharacterized protein conserved in bacteria (DUF2321)
MNTVSENLFQDVMQVCRNGHVVTDQMRTCPERSRYHCERCGATTLHACSTCGQELPGAIVVPGLSPVGTRRPPMFCPTCGVIFPWHRPGGKARSVPALKTLEMLLARLPRVIRELRQRWGTRAPLAIDDQHDLEDLVRALLPLYFDDIRLRSRTPSYCADTRTDFLLYPEKIVLTVKQTSLEQKESHLEPQLREDLAFYRTVPECRMLVVYVFDPQGYLPEPRQLERMWSQADEAPMVRTVISG